MSFLLGAAVVMGGMSLLSGEKARKESRKASKAQEAINRRKNLQSMLSQQRQAMAQRAQIIALGAISGASESSAVQGGASSVGSQLVGNLDYMKELTDLGGEVADANRNAQRYSGYASALGSLAGMVGSMATPSAPTATAPTTAPSVPYRTGF